MTYSSKNARLTLTSQIQSTRFSVLDSRLRTVATGQGSLTATLPPGVYRIDGRLGDASYSDLVTLPPGARKRRDITLEFAAAAPVYGTSTMNEQHGWLTSTLSHSVAEGVGSNSGLVLLLRNLYKRRYPLLTDAVQLLNERFELVSEWNSDWREVPDPERGAAVGRAGRLRPGPYVLRLTENKGTETIDQTIWLSPGWQTLVFVPNGPSGPRGRGVSIQMERLTTPWWELTTSPLATEAALTCLREGISVTPQDMMDNPMQAILAMHTMALSPAPNESILQQSSLSDLRDLIGDHPDVMALAALHPGVVEPVQAPWPPMLLSSYQNCLLPADRQDPSVIPARSVAERVAPYIRQSGPWLRWSATDELLAPQDRSVPGQAKTSVKRLVDEIADLHRLEATEVINRLGVPELARRVRFPETLVQATLSELDLDRPSQLEPVQQAEVQQHLGREQA